MTKKSEVIAARRAALGLRVIVNDGMPAAAPLLKPALAAATSAPSVPSAPAVSRESVLDTSTAYANHCTGGVGITAVGAKVMASPGSTGNGKVSRLSLVPVDGH